MLVYMDSRSKQGKWDSRTDDFPSDMRLDVWSIRSLDNGKTWIDRQRIFKGYCGAITDMLETSTGRLVVPIQMAMRNPGRHVQSMHVSDDKGKTWHQVQLIDLGGHGHHDGALEPTLAELRDGRLWMLIRTNWNRFWEAFSDDHGGSWRLIRPSTIEASSSPGCLRRLASGRLVLVWNRLYPEALPAHLRTSFSRVSRSPTQGLFSTQPASWQREELSIAFSDDDGKKWCSPVVIAREGI